MDIEPFVTETRCTCRMGLDYTGWIFLLLPPPGRQNLFLKVVQKYSFWCLSCKNIYFWLLLIFFCLYFFLSIFFFFPIYVNCVPALLSFWMSTNILSPHPWLCKHLSQWPGLWCFRRGLHFRFMRKRVSEFREPVTFWGRWFNKPSCWHISVYHISLCTIGVCSLQDKTVLEILQRGER